MFTFQKRNSSISWIYQNNQNKIFYTLLSLQPLWGQNNIHTFRCLGHLVTIVVVSAKEELYPSFISLIVIVYAKPITMLFLYMQPQTQWMKSGTAVLKSWTSPRIKFLFACVKKYWTKCPANKGVNRTNPIFDWTLSVDWP